MRRTCRFGTKKGRPHSTGGLYIHHLNNLKRPVRYLQHNIHLVMNIPGPKEPSRANESYDRTAMLNMAEEARMPLVIVRRKGLKLPRSQKITYLHFNGTMEFSSSIATVNHHVRNIVNI